MAEGTAYNEFVPLAHRMGRGGAVRGGVGGGVGFIELEGLGMGKWGENDWRGG